MRIQQEQGYGCSRRNKATMLLNRPNVLYVGVKLQLALNSSGKGYNDTICLVVSDFTASSDFVDEASVIFYCIPRGTYGTKTDLNLMEGEYCSINQRPHRNWGFEFNKPSYSTGSGVRLVAIPHWVHYLYEYIEYILLNGEILKHFMSRSSFFKMSGECHSSRSAHKTTI